MKNQHQEPKENEEIANIEQFQMQRSGGNAADAHHVKNEDDHTYTEKEIPFADGKGTALDESLGNEEDETA